MTPISAPAPVAPAFSATGLSSEEYRNRADAVIKKHVIIAMGLGLIPLTLVDVLGIIAIEVKMIRDLARSYDFPVPHRLLAYKILFSLMGGVGPVYFSAKMNTVLKTFPLLRYTVSAGLLSITDGAAVYAVGKIFQKHFESGGTFLSSDNETLKSFFQLQFQEGKKLIPGYLAR